jgi:Sulfotransferase domain
MTGIPCDAYIMIIGAMKSGTSSLYTYLAQNPQICPCITKEPEFFSDHQQHRYRGVTQYEELWNFDPSRHRFALEASTGYTKYPEELNVPRKIYEYGLRPKFIYLVRNPFDRIRSHHEQLATLFPHFDHSLPLSSDTFVNTSNYALQLDEYRQCFPKKSLLVLDFDELSNSPQRCLSRVFSFLGLSDQLIPISFPVHHQTLSRPQAFVARSQFLRKTARVLPKSARHLSRIFLERIFKRPEWSAAERDIVLKRLAKDMYRFQDEYAIDVSGWGWTQDRRDLLVGSAGQCERPLFGSV